MQFVLMTEPQLGMTYETITDLAQWAERSGLAGFSRSDHYSFGGVEGPHATDAYATLAGLARDTERIDLCVLVSPITFRHPGVIAKMAATIDEMSGGRLRLGMGTGWMEKEHTDFGLDFFDQGGRFDRLEEALEYLHHAFGRKDGPFEGEHYSLEETTVRPLPTGDLPIIVGGFGPKRTPRIAGTWGDEFSFGITNDFEAVRVRVERMREAAEKAGRDPDAILVSMMTAAAVGTDQAAYESNLARIAAADPFGREASALAERYEERGVPLGSADQAQETVGRLEEAGIERLYIQHFGPYEHDLLDDTFRALGAF
jgi:alkanesulfonate monooxygenase SsuD/methylene tetrahydromethanopterin reductase-like flavin-dependent oxidoreductase (luciferase family)